MRENDQSAFNDAASVGNDSLEEELEFQKLSYEDLDMNLIFASDYDQVFCNPEDGADWFENSSLSNEHHQSHDISIQKLILYE